MNGTTANNTSIRLAFLHNFAGSGLVVAANVVTIPILARVLGVDGRGEAAAGTAAVLLAVVLCGLGIPEALTYFIAKLDGIVDRVQVVAALALAIIVGLIGVLLLFLLSNTLSGGSKTVRDLINITSWALIPTLCVGVLRGIASGVQKWNLVGIERSTSALFRAGLLLGLAVSGTLDVKSAAVVVAYTQCSGVFAYVRLVDSRLYGGTSKVSDMMRFGFRVWLGTVAGILLMRIDQVLMVPLSSARELGLYVVAASTAELTLVVNTALREIIYAADAERQDNTRVALASRLSTCGVVLVAVFVAVLAPLVFPILFGDDYAGAVLPCWILLAAIIIGNPASMVGAALSARGRPGLRSAALAIAAVVNVGIVFLLVPLWGAVGASVATLIGNVVSSATVQLMFRRNYSGVISEFYRIRKSDFRVVQNALRRAVD